MSEGNVYATKEAIFSSVGKRDYKDVEHERFGKFTIRSLTDLEKSRYDAEAINSSGKFNRYAAVNANARLIRLAVVVRSDDFNPMFGDQDVSKIQELPSGMTSWLADEIRTFNGFDAAEEAAKN